MYYGLILFAAFLFSVQIVFNDGYRRYNGGSWNSSLTFSLYSSVVGFLLLFVLHGFQIQVSVFSCTIALIYSIVCVIARGYVYIKALTYATISVFSIFSMLGSMLMPMTFSFFMGEKLTISKIICCALILISMIITIDFKRKQSRKEYKYYLGAFVLNGMVGVISKIHQSYTLYCVDSQSFLMLTQIVTIIICIVLLVTQKERKRLICKRTLGYCAGYAMVNTIGNLLLLITLLHLPASVQYPMVSGGTIVFAVIIDKLRKTPVSRKEVLAAVIALIATVFMMI